MVSGSLTEMRVIAVPVLIECANKHARARGPLRAWLSDARSADWQTPADMKARYANATIISSSRVVFNIGGNKYRLVADIDYAGGRLEIRFADTHEKYDRIDPKTV